MLPCMCRCSSDRQCHGYRDDCARIGASRQRCGNGTDYVHFRHRIRRPDGRWPNADVLPRPRIDSERLLFPSRLRLETPDENPLRLPLPSPDIDHPADDTRETKLALIVFEQLRRRHAAIGPAAACDRDVREQRARTAAAAMALMLELPVSVMLPTVRLAHARRRHFCPFSVGASQGLRLKRDAIYFAIWQSFTPIPSRTRSAH